MNKLAQVTLLSSTLLIGACSKPFQKESDNVSDKVSDVLVTNTISPEEMKQIDKDIIEQRARTEILRAEDEKFILEKMNDDIYISLDMIEKLILPDLQARLKEDPENEGIINYNIRKLEELTNRLRKLLERLENGEEGFEPLFNTYKNIEQDIMIMYQEGMKTGVFNPLPKNSPYDSELLL